MGSSIEKYILQHNNEIDDIYPFNPNMKYFLGENKMFQNKNKTFNKYALNHLTIGDFHLISDEYKLFQSFTIVRNPYDRIVSAYNFAYKNSMSFDNLIKKLHDNSIDDLYIIPQYKYVCDNKNNIIVDNIIKFEDKDKIESFLFNVYNSNVSLSHANKSSKKINITLTVEWKEIIYKYYKKDFELFNYDE
jgi:hypothetical protein